VTEEQDTTQVPAPLDKSGDGPVSREALYEMVWSEPMLRVAARFGVSSSYMARVCMLLNVPRPECGYWAKLAVGKAPKQPSLPEPRPGDPLEWTRDGTLPKRSRSLPKPPDRRPWRKPSARLPLPDRYPLVSGAKPLFEAGRLSWHGKYLKPAKRLLVDLVVTKTGLDTAIAFANEFFLALEARDHRAVIAPNSEQLHRADVDERENPGKGYHHSDLWSPMRCTVVYIGTVAIGLTVIEMSEEAEARYVNGEYVRQMAVGKGPERPALPESQPGDPVVWSRTDEFPAPYVPRPRPRPRPAPRPRVPRLVRPVAGTHGLIRGAKEHFLASRKVDEGEHLKPYKKLLVDVTASMAGLDKALGFANDLFKALESTAHRVVIAPQDAQLGRERIDEHEQPPKTQRRIDPNGYSHLWSPYRPRSSTSSR